MIIIFLKLVVWTGGAEVTNFSPKIFVPCDDIVK